MTRRTRSAERNPRRAVVYGRISRNPDEQRDGVQRQVDAGRVWCETHGVEVVETFTDDDVSATKGKPRPGYDAMLAALADEERNVGVLVAARQDRLTRRTRDWLTLVDHAARYGVRVVVLDRDLDLTSAQARAWAAMGAVMGELEAALIAERTAAKVESLRRQGRLTSGGRRPFGYTRDGQGVWDRIEPDEAGLLREAAQRVLAGESPHAIANDWRQAGVTTPYGKPVRGSDVKRYLTNPRVAAFTVHEGVEYPGTWPPILTREEYDAVGDALAQRAARPDRAARAPRHLLSGIARCGGCGGPMVSGVLALPDGRRIYRCDRSRNAHCPQRVVMLAEPLEEYVSGKIVDVFLRRFRSGEIEPTVEDNAGARSATREREIAEVESKRRELLALWRGGHLTPQSYADGMTGLDERLNRLRKEEREDQSGPRVSVERIQDAYRAAFLPDDDDEAAHDRLMVLWRMGTPPAQQRAILEDYVTAVIVDPARGRSTGGVVDLSRVDVIMREALSAASEPA